MSGVLRSRQREPMEEPEVAGLRAESKTQMSHCGTYYILAPTLSTVQGPNCKDKVYNDIRLKYVKDERTGDLSDYAEARCLIEIPTLVAEEKKIPNSSMMEMTYETTESVDLQGSISDD